MTGPARLQGQARLLGANGWGAATFAWLPAGASLPEHRHDWPYLSLHVLGSYRETGEAGDAWIDGPAAAFHPGGTAHADAIHQAGLVTVVIELDPEWLRRRAGPWAGLDRSRYWLGGRIGRSAARLAHGWLGDAPAAARFSRTESFLLEAVHEPPAPAAPPWLDRLDALADSGGSDLDGVAGILGLSRAWAVRAYRTHRGEGLAERTMRRRVERALQLIEQGGSSLAEVAADAGFCDQSHMNRAFRRVVGRTPAQVRLHGLVRTG